MESTVDALNNAYRELVASVLDVLEANELSGGQKTAATDAAVEEFKQRWELFRVSCDQAEESVECMKQQICLECLVDGVTGSIAAKMGQASAGMLPINAVHLEQIRRAVGQLVIELQHGLGAVNDVNSCSSTPFDAIFF